MEITEQTVQEMLAGSDRINLLRREIDGVLKMVLGYLRVALVREERNTANGIKREHICFSFDQKEIHWKIESFGYYDIKVTMTPVSFFHSVLEYSSTLEKVNIAKCNDIDLIEYIGKIHSGLPIFLSLMVEHFPVLLPLTKTLQKAGRSR